MRETRKVLHAAAWILGEYAYELSSPGSTIPLLLTPALYDASVCDASTSAACVHGAVKIFAFWASSISSCWADDGRKPQVDFDDIAVVTKQVVARLEAVQTMTVDAEVQERTVEYRQLFRLIEKDLEAHTPTSAGADKAAEVEDLVSEEKPQVAHPPRSLDLLSPLFFNHALGPLGANAQARVAAPFDVDLYAWIVNPDAYVVLDGIDLAAHADFDEEPTPEAPAAPEPAKPSAKESKAQREARLQRQRDDPFYIVDSARQPSTAAGKGGERDDDVDDIPIVRLDSLMDAAPAPAKLQPRVLEAEEMPADMPKPKPKKKAAKPAAAPADAADDDGAATPTKVVRVKKKKAASKPTASQVTID